MHPDNFWLTRNCQMEVPRELLKKHWFYNKKRAEETLPPSVTQLAAKRHPMNGKAEILYNANGRIYKILDGRGWLWQWGLSCGGAMGMYRRNFAVWPWDG